VLFEPLDPNERFRERRRRTRRRRRLRRAAALTVLLLAAAALALGARLADGDDPANTRAASAASAPEQARKPASAPVRRTPRPAPAQIRGVHVTMALASLPGKLEEYLSLPGLNAVELDVKDENGEIGFVPSAVPLARKTGAAKPYYKPRAAVAQARRHGVYLIGRVVCFEDPVLSTQRPALAVRRRDGSVWRNDAGLGWTNPYDRRVWAYNVAVAAAAARAGFDEIQFDYVRFPTDGDLSQIVYPGEAKTPPGWVIAAFVHYASKRLRPLGVRVSVDLFGLSATRDLGIGQMPRRIGKYVDAVYPMVYPSHYNAGEYGLPDPSAYPGETVAQSLTHFRRELDGLDVDVIPWLQDFSLGRTYTIDDVKAQIDAARAASTRGFMLWNAAGVYTAEALRYEPKPS
jgi:hypothetical protein